MTIISPFDESAGGGTTTTTTSVSYGEVLDLTEENVEKVLEDMRPYLQQDGGDVSLQEIDGPIVKLELQVNGRSPDFSSQMAFLPRFNLSFPHPNREHAEPAHPRP